MTSEPAIEKSQRGFPCRQCGANLEFAPGTTSLKCPYCTTENAITPTGEVAEQDFASTLASLERDAPRTEVRTVKCQACAAEVTVPPNVTSFSCCFCGSNIVSQVVSASRLTPQGVLPFLVTKEKAVASFRSWITSRWFAPSALKGRSLIDEQLAGVYLPAWTYDAFADTVYTGERGDAYYVTVGSGNSRRTERRIRWSSASGRVQNKFDDVLVIASKTLPEERVTALEPWDLKASQPYADEFLAGFRAETYQIDLKAGWGLAQREMADSIELSIRADIGGDEQRITGQQTRYSQVTFKHLLLPVWVSAYRYSGKVYRFLINARTGEVQGERPYSAWKIAGAVLLGLVALGVIIVLVNQK